MGELTCKAVKARKGTFTLEVSALTIARGEKIAVLGENGCGKTTLLHTLAGLQPAEGEICHDGTSWAGRSPAERALHMSFLPQETELLFNLSVHELVDLTLYRNKLLPADRRGDVFEALEMTAFGDRAYPSLSGGEKRRAMLARILCRDADFILLDEPTASLDMRHSAMFMRYAAGIEAAVVAAIHDLNLAVRYFDRFLLMKHGSILFDRRREELDGNELEEIYGIELARHGDYFVPVR